jgi:hypothetical protein
MDIRRRAGDRGDDSEHEVDDGHARCTHEPANPGRFCSEIRLRRGHVVAERDAAVLEAGAGRRWRYLGLPLLALAA